MDQYVGMLTGGPLHGQMQAHHQPVIKVQHQSKALAIGDEIPPSVQLGEYHYEGRWMWHPVKESLDNIHHLAAPKYPQFRFELHPRERTVYVVSITGGQEHGRIVADEIDTDLQARVAVLIWLRGYVEGGTKIIGQQ